ncbi:uncharacterized protein LOC133917382 [Phragmites australis]|uniref:uncharacterized protein LOC133917382 n=1 Tax=Phragmites australis TaxID=29695 RepID=UPI002D7910CD|nr:uncharacterized protein LOC133917382 [Phragmites australis]
MGLELELLSTQLPPIRTTAAAGAAAMTRLDGHDDGCATPTSASNVLRAPSVCPLAPRKPSRPAKRKLQRHCAAPRWFIAVPHDLAALFVARPALACRPPAGKKIRVHVVG